MPIDIANMVVNIGQNNPNGWVDIFSALLTPMITIFMAFIAWQQWQTNEKKRKQDLFEKRWKLYKKIKQRFVDIVMQCITKKVCKFDKFGNSQLTDQEKNESYYKELLDKAQRNLTFDDIQMKFIFYLVKT
jgi:nicotinamide riboside transporter PnuC